MKQQTLRLRKIRKSKDQQEWRIYQQIGSCLYEFNNLQDANEAKKDAPRPVPAVNLPMVL